MQYLQDENQELKAELERYQKAYRRLLETVDFCISDKWIRTQPSKYCDETAGQILRVAKNDAADLLKA